MMKGHGMEIIEGKIEALDPLENECYTFLGVEEAGGQLDKVVKERVIMKCFETARKLLEMNLYDRNLIKAINTKCMAMVRYSMTVCHYGKKELKALDVRMRKVMIDRGFRNEHESIKILYMARRLGGR